MQESGLIFPLTCTSDIWGQYPVISYPELPQRFLLAISDACDILCYAEMAGNIPFITNKQYAIKKKHTDQINSHIYLPETTIMCSCKDEH